MSKVFERDFLCDMGWEHRKFCREMGVEPGTDVGVVCCRCGYVPFTEVRSADVAVDAINASMFPQFLPERGAEPVIVGSRVRVIHYVGTDTNDGDVAVVGEESVLAVEHIAPQGRIGAFHREGNEPAAVVLGCVPFCEPDHVLINFLFFAVNEDSFRFDFSGVESSGQFFWSEEEVWHFSGFRRCKTQVLFRLWR
mgnify:CR=1 FL=1